VLDKHHCRIVRPGTGDPVAAGEVGELVVSLNLAYPLIVRHRRPFGPVAGRCPQAAPTPIKGWMGRADQTTKIRGMFVHPGQVADIARRFPEVLKARLVVSGEMANDVMTLKVEAESVPKGLDERIGDAIRDVTKLRGDVQLLRPGSLPNDGKVIEDARSISGASLEHIEAHQAASHLLEMAEPRGFLRCYVVTAMRKCSSAYDLRS
jgi:phenylacetate-CoA ligase